MPNKYKIVSLELCHEFPSLRFQLLQLVLESLKLLHFLEQSRLLGANVQFYDLHLGEVHFVPVLPALQLFLLGHELGLELLGLLLPLLELLLPLLDLLLLLGDLLVEPDFQLDVSLLHLGDLLVQVVNLDLSLLDLLVHPLDAELTLPELLLALVLLLLQVLLEEAEVAGPLVVDLLAGALPAGRATADATT